MGELRFDGRSAVITGAGRGVGRTPPDEVVKEIERLAFMESPGVTVESLTVEDGAANVAAVTDMSGAQALAWL